MEYVDFSNAKDDSVWTIKYCPRTVDQVIGNSDVINTIGNWLLDFEKNKQTMLTSDGTKKRKRKTKIKISEKDLVETNSELTEIDLNNNEITNNDLDNSDATYKDINDDIDTDYINSCTDNDDIGILDLENIPESDL